MHLFPMEPAGECMGYTFKVAPDDHEMETQQRHTGSSTVWSDIVLKVAMQNNPQKVNRLSEVNDWRPDQLHPVNLWHIGGAQVVTLIHELMHSTVLTRPVTIHGMVGDAMANDLGQIMNLANTNGEGVVDNPETYGYLALGK
jgi:hypothetical protein